MRDLLVGAAGSALALVVDLAVTQWGENNMLIRIGSAAAAFAVFYVASVVFPWEGTGTQRKRILSGMKSKGSTKVDAGKIESPGATEILAGIVSDKDIDIKINEVKS